MVTLSVNSIFRATPGPWEACPNPFSFFDKTVLRSDKMNMSHFLKETAEQILLRYQVIAMTAQLLSYAIWVTYAETTWPPLPLPFYYFEKQCRHLLVGKGSLPYLC